MQVGDDPRVGTVLAGYRLEALLGRGALGVVYLAEDVRLGRRVALRLLSPEPSADRRFRERFLRESKLAASIDHPNIVPVYEAGEAEGLLYVAMGYVEGADLAGLLAREGRLEPGRALSIVTQLAAALDAARWSRGLVHGGLGPSRVLIGPAVEPAPGERVFLLGFGARQELPPGATLADAPRHFATVDYLAPEQIEGKPVSPRTDVYALGCVLFECLTGRPPFEGDSPDAILNAHLHEPAPSATEVRTGLPAGIDGVIGKAMEKWPEERYSTCEELAAFARAAFAPVAEQPGRVPGDGSSSPVALPLRPGRAPEEPPPSRTTDRGPVVEFDPSAQRFGNSRRKSIAAIGFVCVVAALAVGAIWLIGSDTVGPGSAAPAPPDTGTPNEVAVEEGAATTERTAETEAAAEPASDDPGSLVRIDAATGEILGRVAIPFPELMASDGRFVWVLSDEGAREKLVRIEAATNAVTGTFDAAAEHPVTWLAAEGGSAWFGDDAGRVYRLARGMSVVEEVTFDSQNIAWGSPVAAAGSLWVSWFPPGGCCLPPPDLYRVDPSTRRVIARIDGGGQVVAAGSGFLWALVSHEDADADFLMRIDTETYATAPLRRMELTWADYTATDGAVWASSPRDNTIVRLDALTGEEEERVGVSGRARTLAAGGGAVWAAISEDGTVVRYSIVGRRLTTIDVGGTPNALVFAHDSIWVAVDEPSQPR